MWTSGFFNSVNGDRLYNAEQMSAIFEGLITDGVYESVGNKMAVQPNSGMTIQINTGRGWFGRHWVNNDAAFLQTLEESDVLLNRYCAVCVRVDDTNAVRDAVPYFKYSEFATTPVKPTMERTETVKEYCLAYVYIKAGAKTITASDIEDTRGNTELCGWVTGLIEQLNTTTMFEQWEDIFNNWLAGLQDLINENTETMLVAALPVSVTVTLSASDWEWSSEKVAYIQTVSAISMNTTKTVLIQPTAESGSNYATAEIRCISQADNELVFSAVSRPTVDIDVNVTHMGK